MSHFRATGHVGVIQFRILVSYRATLFLPKTFIAVMVYTLFLQPRFWRFVFMREIGASQFSLFFSYSSVTSICFFAALRGFQF